MKQQISESIAALKQKGAVLLVPTETVYGLVCDWEDTEARDRIYTMKHRAENKPLAAFVPSPETAEKLCGCPLPENAIRLARTFMPGPITLVVPDANGSTFGFRIPDHPFILALLKQYGRALASTSANLSGHPPALNPADALASLTEPPNYTVNGGELPRNSVASTVVLIRADNSIQILREGVISKQHLEEILKKENEK